MNTCFFSGQYQIKHSKELADLGSECSWSKRW